MLTSGENLRKMPQQQLYSDGNQQHSFHYNSNLLPILSHSPQDLADDDFVDLDDSNSCNVSVASSEDYSSTSSQYISNEPQQYNTRQVKRRRRLNEEETNILMEVFKNNTKPDPELRAKLAEKLNMPSRAIQVWFQNRRAKVKRGSQDSRIAASVARSNRKLTLIPNYIDPEDENPPTYFNPLSSPALSTTSGSSFPSPPPISPRNSTLVPFRSTNFTNVNGEMPTLTSYFNEEDSSKHRNTLVPQNFSSAFGNNANMLNNELLSTTYAPQQSQSFSLIDMCSLNNDHQRFNNTQYLPYPTPPLIKDQAHPFFKLSDQSQIGDSSIHVTTSALQFPNNIVTVNPPLTAIPTAPFSFAPSNQQPVESNYTTTFTTSSAATFPVFITNSASQQIFPNDTSTENHTKSYESDYAFLDQISQLRQDQYPHLDAFDTIGQQFEDSENLYSSPLCPISPFHNNVAPWSSSLPSSMRLSKVQHITFDNNHLDIPITASDNIVHDATKMRISSIEMGQQVDSNADSTVDNKSLHLSMEDKQTNSISMNSRWCLLSCSAPSPGADDSSDDKKFGKLEYCEAPEKSTSRKANPDTVEEDSD